MTGKGSGVDAPTIPDAFDLLASGRVFLKSVHFVADFEGDDVPVTADVAVRDLCDGGHGTSVGYAGVALARGEWMDGIAVDDERERLPCASTLGGRSAHGGNEMTLARLIAGERNLKQIRPIRHVPIPRPSCYPLLVVYADQNTYAHSERWLDTPTPSDASPFFPTTVASSARRGTTPFEYGTSRPACKRERLSPVTQTSFAPSPSHPTAKRLLVSQRIARCACGVCRVASSCMSPWRVMPLACGVSLSRPTGDESPRQVIIRYAYGTQIQAI